MPCSLATLAGHGAPLHRCVPGEGGFGVVGAKATRGPVVGQNEAQGPVEAERRVFRCAGQSRP